MDLHNYIKEDLPQKHDHDSLKMDIYTEIGKLDKRMKDQGGQLQLFDTSLD